MKLATLIRQKREITEWKETLKTLEEVVKEVLGENCEISDAPKSILKKNKKLTICIFVMFCPVCFRFDMINNLYPTVFLQCFVLFEF